MSEVIVVLDNIRSAHNVGSVFRTSDGAGVSEIILGGYTPTPTDRFGRVQPEIAKTSLGASETIPWESVPEAELAKKLHALKQADYTIVAIEQTSDSQSLTTFTPPQKICYIFGNEVDGVRREVLAVADSIVDIPMLGAKESLNISVSVGVVLYHGLFSS